VLKKSESSGIGRFVEKDESTPVPLPRCGGELDGGVRGAGGRVMDPRAEEIGAVFGHIHAQYGSPYRWNTRLRFQCLHHNTTIRGESPMLPGSLQQVPPVEVAAKKAALRVEGEQHEVPCSCRE